MDRYILDLKSKILELVNYVEINKDIDGEFSIERHDLRTAAIKDLESITSVLADAKAALEKTTQIHQKNIEKIKKIVEFNPPNMLCENINGLYITARKINYLEEAGPDLCFMPTINRFVIQVAGNTLIGNIGNIYDICPDPERVKECRFSNLEYLPSSTDIKYKSPKCSKLSDGECRFYHNPLVFASAKEPRNYFSTCSQYVSATSTLNNSNFCRFGSRQHLKEDLNRLTPEEARRFEDYVAHMFLCWLLLRRYKPCWF